MDKYGSAQQRLARMAELFDLPADLVAGLARIELLGDRELYLEGHRGILSYGEEQIDVSLGALALRIHGRGLTLRGMSGEELRLRGSIDGVTFIR